MSNRKPNKVVSIDRYRKTTKWRKNKLTKFIHKNNIKLLGIDHIFYYEKFEQYLVSKWIKPYDIVLEIGARVGIVSSCINMYIKDKKNQVSVEPDIRVHDMLKQNRKLTKSHFRICKNILGNHPVKLSLTEHGLATHIVEDNDKVDSENIITIQNITVQDFFNKYKLNFNVLVVDCEGCLGKLLREDGDLLLKNITLVIFEMDRTDVCNYDEVIDILINKNFTLCDKIQMNRKNELNEYEPYNFQQVWIKN